MAVATFARANSPDKAEHGWADGAASLLLVDALVGAATAAEVPAGIETALTGAPFFTDRQGRHV